MYESAREKLKELLKQEEEIRNQIGHWLPVVEQLSRICGESVDPALLKRANKVASGESAGKLAEAPGEEMGLTEAIRWVFRQPLMLPLTPTQVRNHLAEMGYDLSKYAHVMPPIHNTLKRMKEAGEIREVEGVGGMGRAFEIAGSARNRP
jgi:hypothetical protein